MIVNGIEIIKIHDNLWEIPRFGKMKVPGRVYTTQKMLENFLSKEEALKQVINVACLPGIQKFSLAMPDIHWGYGFPIGGVAATDLEYGVISPGGVGYDINCGVRLATTSLEYGTINKKIKPLLNALYNNIPTGVGSHGAIKKLSPPEVKKILEKGSEWALENGFATDNDLAFTEERGKFKEADTFAVSSRAIERGQDQAGTLGSGNHFLEIDVVDEIYQQNIAERMGFFPGQVVIQIHTGSRGLGYQICDDYLKTLLRQGKKYGFDLPDKQLACAPIHSEEGKDYFNAMKCAANFAWNNRQIIMSLTKRILMSELNISERDLQFNLVYDVAHNIAKIEEHDINGTLKKVCVHRKGATRAFPPNSKELPEKYKTIGQPVLIPGDMGRYSFVGVGSELSMKETFGSSCHGAGRLKSRQKSIKMGKGRNLVEELNNEGVEIQARGFKTIAEEMPYAYKDVSEVIQVMHNSKITKKVIRLRPVGVIKG